MQLSMLVNRTLFGDSKDFNPFTLSHKTLYFPSLCVVCYLRGYLIGLSGKVPLNKPGIMERHKFKGVTLVATFLAQGTRWRGEK